jgi:hypothetical protein
MKKKILFLLWFSIAGFMSANGQSESRYSISISNIETLRLKYYSAVEDEDFIPELEKYINQIFNSEKAKHNPLYYAYMGGVSAVKSKHAFWPHKKLSYLNNSMEMLQKAISIAHKDLEIRFMRFSILHYVPGFLGYSSEKEEDARMIVNLLVNKEFANLSREIQKGIVEFMLASNRLTDSESDILKRSFQYLLLK